MEHRRHPPLLVPRLMAAPLFLLSLTLTSARAFQLVPSRHEFHEGERIDVFVEPLHGRFQGIRLHDLPLCQSPDLDVVPPRRFLDLFKPPLYRTIYDIKALKTEACKLLCVSPRVASQGQPSQNLLSLLMHDDPVESSVALHVADGQLAERRHLNHSHHSPGHSSFALGFRTADDFFVNNHVSFFFEYTPVGRQSGGRQVYTMTHASAETKSTATSPNSISKCEQQSLHQRYAGDVLFTYSVHWTLKPMNHERPLDAATHSRSRGSLKLLLVVIAAAAATILGLSAAWRLPCHSLCRLGADAGNCQKLPAQRPLLGAPLWPETLAALAGSGVLAAGLLFLAGVYEPSQGHTAIPAVLFLVLLGASCGVLTSWLCELLHQQPMSAYSLVVLSTLPTAAVLGPLWSVEALLAGGFQWHMAASAASAVATSLLAICCSAFAGLLLTLRLRGPHTNERHLGILPLHPSKAISSQLLWLMAGTWMLLAGSFSLLVVLYWPWRGMQTALLVASLIHVVATSQLAAVVSISGFLCQSDGQWLWRAFWMTFAGGLLLGAGTCLIFLERASLNGYPMFAGLLLPCASFSLVLGLISGGLCVTVCAWFLRMTIGGAHSIVLE